MFPDDPAIASLKEQSRLAKHWTNPSWLRRPLTEATAGNRALSAGDPVAATEHYRKAEELGLKSVFAKFNLAMAKCLEGENPANHYDTR